MGKSVYDAIKALCAESLTDSLLTWISTIFTALENLCKNGLFTNVMNVLAAIACSFLVMYFYMDFTSQAERELLTLENLIKMFIKLLAGFVILLVLPDLLSLFIKLGAGFKDMMSDKNGIAKAFTKAKTAKKITYNFSQSLGVGRKSGSYNNTKFPEWSGDVKKMFESRYAGVSDFFKGFSTVANAMLFNFLHFIGFLAGALVSTGIAVKFIARCVFSPIAVVQCFEDGTRSSGIRYLKILLADMLTFSVMIVILYAVQALTLNTINDTMKDMNYTITFDNLGTLFSIKNAGKLLVPQLAGIGGMIAAEKIAHDVVGA